MLLLGVRLSKKFVMFIYPKENCTVINPFFFTVYQIKIITKNSLNQKYYFFHMVKIDFVKKYLIISSRMNFTFFSDPKF